MQKSAANSRFSGYKGILVLISASLLTLILLEFGLRVFIHFRAGTPILDLRPYLHDDELMWVANPGYQGPISGCRKAKINSSGFRGRNLNQPVGKDKIILSFGDSNTFGYRIESADSLYPALLENALQGMPEHSYTVFNCGMNGYSSYQGKISFRRIIRNIKPDYITLYFGWDDLWKSNIEDKNAGGRKNIIQRPGIKSTLMIMHVMKTLNNYFMGRVLEKRTQHSSDDYIPRVSIPDFKANLNQIIDETENLGAKAILFSYPMDINNDLAMKEFTPYQHALREVTNSSNVLFFDAQGILLQYPIDKILIDPENDCVHISPFAHKLIADSLAKIIYELENDTLKP